MAGQNASDLKKMLRLAYGLVGTFTVISVVGPIVLEKVLRRNERKADEKR